MENVDLKNETPAIGNVMLSVGLIVSIFTAAGYEFTKEEPSGRLLFWHGATEQNVQFWYDNKTDLTKVMELIGKGGRTIHEISGRGSLSSLSLNAQILPMVGITCTTAHHRHTAK